MLGDRLAATGASAWLVNTGWTGGPYGVGKRMPIAATRALVRAADIHSGSAPDRLQSLENLDILGGIGPVICCGGGGV